MTRFYSTSPRLAELVERLSERDLAVVATLRRLGVASAIQLERLHFADTDARQRRRVLAKLTDQRVIRRLDRRVGGVRSGSAGFIYSLDVAGQQLVDSSGTRRPRQLAAPSLPFLQHALDVSELYVRLTESARVGDLELVEFDAEPTCWRTYVGAHGARRVLKPDAYVVVAVDELEHHWFVEVDRATHGRAAFIRKLEDYRRYRSSGTEQEHLDLFPLVLITVPDAERYEVVTDWIGAIPAADWPLFKVSQYEQSIDAMARRQKQ